MAKVVPSHRHGRSDNRNRYHNQPRGEQPAITPLDVIDHPVAKTWNDKEKEAEKKNQHMVNSVEENSPKTQLHEVIKTENHDVLAKTVKRWPMSIGFRPLTIFLLPFGFNMWSSGKPKWYCYLYMVPLRLSFSGYLAFCAKNIHDCYKNKARPFKDPGCKDEQMMSNGLDLLFAAICFVALICHDGSIRRLLNDTVNDAHISDDSIFSASRQRRKVKGFTALSALLSTLLLAISVAATVSVAGMDIARVVLTFKLKTVFLLAFPFVHRLFSMMVVGTMSAAIILTSMSLGGVGRALVDLETVHDASVIDDIFRPVARLVYHCEACFSNVLPSLLAIVFVKYFLFFEEIVGESIGMSVYIKLPSLLYHLAIILLVILPALSVNIKVQSLFTVPPPVAKSTIFYETGYYAPNTPTGSLNTIAQSMFRHQGRLPTLTAGGVKISTWFIIKGIAAFLFSYWFRVQLSYLYDAIEESIKEIGSRTSRSR